MADEGSGGTPAAGREKGGALALAEHIPPHRQGADEDDAALPVGAGPWLQRLPIADLIARTARESERYSHDRPFDDCYGLELVRRAIVLRDPDAWQALYAQYHGLVRDWLLRGSRHRRADDLDDLVIRVFARFWRSVGPGRLAAFATLGGVLKYLKMCTRTVLIDEMRAARAWASRRADAAELAVVADERQHVARSMMHEVMSYALWHAVERALPESRERLVIDLSFVRGLKPREIAEAYGHLFPTVEEVYRHKRLALAHLRRDPGLHAFWHDATWDADG